MTIKLPGHVELLEDHCNITLTIPYDDMERAFADLANPQFWDVMLDSIRAALTGRDIGIQHTHRRIRTQVMDPDTYQHGGKPV